MATEVGSAYVTLVPSARGFAGKMQRELAGDLTRAGDSTGRTYGDRFSKSAGGGISGKAKSIFGGLAKAGPLVAAAAGAVVGKVLADSIGAASDLGETISKAGQIFGQKAVPQLEAFAGKAATALGQSKQQALDAASTFAVFGKSAGLSGDKLVGFSTDFTSLASDMASFHNSSPQEAIDAIGAALRGEAEPMRRFGVLLDDASMREEALRLGLIKNTKTALTPQQKVLAAQALIYKQTKDAQGDFSRTSGGLANQQRILTAQWENAKVSIGKGLLPIVTKLLTWANQMMPKLGGLAKVVSGALGPAFKAIGGVAKDVFGIFTYGLQEGAGDVENTGFFAVVEGIGRALAGVVPQVRGFVKQLVGGFKQVLPVVVGLAKTVAANVVPIIVTLANTIATKIYPALLKVASYIVANVLPVVTRLAGIVMQNVVPALASMGRFIAGTLVPAVVAIATKIGQKLKPVFDALFTAIRNRVIPAVVLITGKFREWQPTIQQVISVVVKIVGKVLEFAAAILGKVLPVVIKLAGWLITYLVKGLITTITVIAKVIGAAIRFGVTLYKAGAAVVGFVKGVVAWIGKLWGTWQALWARITGYITFAWRAIKAGATAGVTWLVNFIKGIPGRLVALGRNFLDAGKRLIGQLVSGLKNIAGGIASAVTTITKAVTGIPGKIVALGKHFKDAGGKLIGQLVEGLKGAGRLVSDVAGKVWDAVKGLLNDAIGKINRALEFKIGVLGQTITFNPPDIPRLAAGGRAYGGTLAVIGEGREPETVLPDSMLRGLLERTAAGAAPNVRVWIGDRELTDIIAVQFDQAQTTQARRLVNGRRA